MYVIAFEGLDGSGKTTAAHGIAMQLGGSSLRQIIMPPDLKRQRQTVNAGHDVEARFKYFLKLNTTQMEYARWPSTRHLTAFDTTIYRTVITHRVLGSKAAALYDLSSRPELLPDHTFYIDTPEAVRIERLKARDGGLVHPSHWDKVLYEHQDEVRAGYEAAGLPVLDGRQPADQLLAEAIKNVPYNTTDAGVV